MSSTPIIQFEDKLRRELLRCLRSPEDREAQRRHIESARRVLSTDLHLVPRPWMGDGMLCLTFDRADKQIEPTDGRAPKMQRDSGWWHWYLSVSRRGAFITCQTATLPAQERPKTELPRLDIPVRSIAEAWTRRVASEANLIYLPSSALLAWEVDQNEIDPGFYLDHAGSGPNAFQVLFHE